MNIFGKEISKEELQQKTGDISQLGGVKYYELTDGVSRGVRAIDLKSPCGLDFTVLLDRGMDISSFSYKSVPIAWRSATRDTSPVYYESRGIEWLRTFYGGLYNFPRGGICHKLIERKQAFLFIKNPENDFFTAYGGNC